MVWNWASIKPILNAGGTLAGKAAASAAGGAAGSMIFNRAIESRIAALVLPPRGDGAKLLRDAKTAFNLGKSHKARHRNFIKHFESSLTLAQGAADKLAGIERCQALLLAASCWKGLGDEAQYEYQRDKAKALLRSDNKLLFRCCSFLRRLSDTLKNYGSIQAFFLGGAGALINAATFLLPGAPAVAALRLCLSISAAGFSGLILAKLLTEFESSLGKIAGYGRSEFGGAWFSPEMLDRLHPEQLPFGVNEQRYS